MKGAKCIKDSFESQSVQLSATGLPPTIDHLKFQNCLGKVEPSVFVLVHFFDHPPKAEIGLLHKRALPCLLFCTAATIMTFKAQKVLSNQVLQYLCEDGSGDAGVLAQAESQTAIPMLGVVLQHSRPPPLGWSTATNT